MRRGKLKSNRCVALLLHWIQVPTSETFALYRLQSNRGRNGRQPPRFSYCSVLYCTTRTLQYTCTPLGFRSGVRTLSSATRCTLMAFEIAIAFPDPIQRVRSLRRVEAAFNSIYSPQLKCSSVSLVKTRIS